MDQLARSVLFIIRLTDQKNGGGAARLVGVDGFAFLLHDFSAKFHGACGSGGKTLALDVRLKR